MIAPLGIRTHHHHHILPNILLLPNSPIDVPFLMLLPCHPTGLLSRPPPSTTHRHLPTEADSSPTQTVTITRDRIRTLPEVDTRMAGTNKLQWGDITRTAHPVITGLGMRNTSIRTDPPGTPIILLPGTLAFTIVGTIMPHTIRRRRRNTPRITTNTVMPFIPKGIITRMHRWNRGETIDPTTTTNSSPVVVVVDTHPVPRTATMTVATIFSPPMVAVGMNPSRSPLTATAASVLLGERLFPWRTVHAYSATGMQRRQALLGSPLTVPN